ncbi:GNAT family N-acetyltransferase [Bizionia myxarmorum]|uniref:GNAT family N-acetyltransferase n=1 Tax=Bizionia myxarmorum TaxID=291186 RepID=A0A5D0R5Q4_9FLAO|nr:GNAT family N-acetyltransferase [Bizionia myxarmorum]TYB76226.1 GNAT family N-acetyltransferase [Bizionia myxarmorum]
MIKNPFSSDTFETIWLKHFNKNNPKIKPNFISPVSFYKHNLPSCYINTGNKLTNGLTYQLNSDAEDFKGNVYLVRDIPSYQDVAGPEPTSDLKRKKIFQYEGYITRVGNYESLDSYLNTIYKSNTRSKLRRNMSRLEASFDVDYTMYHGSISKEKFDIVFYNFYKLFEKRYTNKGEPCGELEPSLWTFYTELAYNMINEGTASLFVIYCDKKPIGITFSYHFDTILVEALTVFDIDFYRYNIGHTTILKMLEWSFNNGIKIFDYTQGDFEYKKRWSDDSYQTHYHILYDSKSLKSRLVANFLEKYFNFKREFRDRNYSTKVHNLKYKLVGGARSKAVLLDAYKVEVITDENYLNNISEPIDLELDMYFSQRKALYDYLYMNPEPAKNIKAYLYHNNTVLVKGKTNLFNVIKDEA